MADLIVERKDKTFVVKTQAGSFEVTNTWENEKVMMIFLRLWQHPWGEGAVYTFQQIAQAFGYKDRQEANNYWRRFWQCGGEFLPYLVRKRKVDQEVVEAVEGELRKKIWSPLTELSQRVNQHLGRKNLTPANMEAALEQIPCTVLRDELIRNWEEGLWHPKEEVILEEVLTILEQGEETSKEQAVEVLRGVGVKPKLELVQEGVQQNQWEAALELLEVDRPVESLEDQTRQMVFAINLYYWNVPLSRIGRWMGRGKSTIYGWVIGLAVALWDLVEGWVIRKVKGQKVYVDELWLKIRKKWHYWYVAIEEGTGLPIKGHLLKSRGKWGCRWFMLKLKRLGVDPSRIHTDGLAGYESAIAKVFPLSKHIGCLFHHQQGVSPWVNKHLANLEKEEVKKVKKKMKRVVQTEDTRTVKRRLRRLEADDAKYGWGIAGWIANTWKNLDRLVPALRRNRYPRTTNEIERFFRAFRRFYKTRGGFHSVGSAKRELMLFMVVYFFTQQEETGKAPIESIVPEAVRMPLYRLLNDPFGYGMATRCWNNSRLEKMATVQLKKAA
jgi:transposase-like protein